MTRRSLALLRQVKDQAVFIPTTTRTEEQYHRICLGVGNIEYALVCNGGVLLCSGQEDKTWYQESLKQIEGCQEELEKAAYKLTADTNRILEVRNIRNLFLFTKSAEPSRSVERLKKILNLSVVDVFCNGSKVYVLPRQLNKGLALRRLMQRLGGGATIAAGDSIFDIPMLNAADLALAPIDLTEEKDCKKHVIGIEKAGVFSDAMLVKILTYCKKDREGLLWGMKVF